MDEITFVDVLTHYQGRLQEAVEQLSAVREQIKQALILAETGWSGIAAEACENKLNYLNQELARADSDISEAMVTLNAVGAAFAEGEAEEA